MRETIIIYGSFLILACVIVFVLIKIRSSIELFKEIAYDTLKRDGKWSRTSLTMFVGIGTAVYLTIADFIKQGFNFDVFMAWLAVGLGSKVTDAISRKLDPTIGPPQVTTI